MADPVKRIELGEAGDVLRWSTTHPFLHSFQGCMVSTQRSSSPAIPGDLAGDIPLFPSWQSHREMSGMGSLGRH